MYMYTWFRATPVLRGYAWICAQESFLEGFEGPYERLMIEHRLVICRGGPSLLMAHAWTSFQRQDSARPSENLVLCCASGAKRLTESNWSVLPCWLSHPDPGASHQSTSYCLSVKLFSCSQLTPIPFLSSSLGIILY